MTPADLKAAQAVVPALRPLLEEHELPSILYALALICGELGDRAPQPSAWALGWEAASRRLLWCADRAHDPFEEGEEN